MNRVLTELWTVSVEINARFAYSTGKRVAVVASYPMSCLLHGKEFYFSTNLFTGYGLFRFSIFILFEL